MIRNLILRARRFRRGEKGNATIEFCILFPFFMWLTLSGVEIGLLAFNHANLERALDETIRDVRLNRLDKYVGHPSYTEGEGWSHGLLKDIVCEKAAFIPDCSSNLALEMTSIDPRAGISLDPAPFCVDTPVDVRSSQTYEPGGADELMIVRACVEISTLWIGSDLSRLARLDTDGQYELHATTVFVHEPS